MTAHRDIREHTALDGHLHLHRAAIARSRGCVHPIPIGRRCRKFLFHQWFGRLGLGRQRVIDRLTGQGVLYRAQNAAGGIGSFRNGIHLPCLCTQDHAQQPPGTLEEGLRFMACLRDLQICDAAILHGHLHFYLAAVPAGGAGVNAVGIGQLCGQFFFRLLCGFAGRCRYGRLFQLFRHSSQHRAGVRQCDQHCCCHHRCRKQLDQRQQLFPDRCFPHGIPLSDMENKVTP